MDFIIVENDEKMSLAAAEEVARTVQRHPDCVLGLATGSTPMRMYDQLVRMFEADQIDFSQVKTFNLDEYVGLSIDHPRSYHVYMQDFLFSKVNISSEHIFIPDGTALNLHKECEKYEEAIHREGGIDLQILGLGVNGHIGFNEPGSDPKGITSVVQLAESTIQVNSRFFDSYAKVPKQAITVGIGTILNHCKRILLLASGEEKARAVKHMVTQQPNMANPASYLNSHKNVTVIVDKLAAQHIL